MAGIEQNPYLTGPRVYNGSSHAPNTGRTSKPQGYVQREINNRNKSQAQSGGQAEAFLRARDAHAAQQEQPSLQQPLIPEAYIPIGNSGILKDPTGRLHYGGITPATPQAAPPPQSPTSTAQPPTAGPTV